MRKLFDELAARNMVAQVSSPALAGLTETQKICLYVGFDPTARSLHLGHLLPVMQMAWFQRHGHRVIALVGGATGMVGDPSGRSTERNLLTREQIEENGACVQAQLRRFLDFEGPNAARMADNYEWIGRMTFIEWLRDVGKYFNVHQMMSKDSVRKRMETEQGISFTEFSYQTMQAYDFLHLHDTAGCLLQAGGNDQWGNITAGIDLVRKRRGVEVFGLTLPLITTASGEKFGKSAGNAIWLDPELTSPYRFYQYWLQADDRDVGRYLKYFCFLPIEEIDALVRAHDAAPEKRQGQKRLAEEMTRLVHGEQALHNAEKASQLLFGGELDGLSDAELLDIFADVPSCELPRARLETGFPLLDLLVAAGRVASKGEARRLIAGGGFSLNNRRVASPEQIVTPADLASETVMIVRTGKKNYALIRFV